MYIKRLVHEVCKIKNGDRKADVLRLEQSIIKYGPDTSTSVTCAIYVNDVELKNTLQNCPTCSDMRGGFADIYLGELYDNIKGPTDDYGETIYGCGCGISDCNPLYVRIREYNGYVIWDRFEHNCVGDNAGPHWELGALIFEKEQYYSEVKKLKSWVDEIGSYYTFKVMLGNWTSTSRDEVKVQEYLNTSIADNARYCSHLLPIYGKTFQQVFLLDKEFVKNKYLHVVPLSLIIKDQYSFLLQNLNGYVILKSDMEYQRVEGVYYLTFKDGLLSRVNYLNDCSIFNFTEFMKEVNDEYVDGDDYDDEEEPESGAKAKYTYLYDIIKRFIDCSFREKYEYEPLVQNYKKQFVKEFQEFGEGNEFENDHSFYFKHEYASGHSAIEVYTESNFIQITSCGYAIGNCGGDSYTNWQCTLYNDGEEEADVEVNGIMEELNTFPYAESTLTIDSPDEFYFNGEVNDDDDSE